MENKIVFLDDSPSLLDQELNDFFRDNIKGLLILFNYFKDKNILVQMNSSIHDLRITESITLKEVTKDLKNGVKEELQRLKLTLSKYPYSIDISEEVSIKNAEIFHESTKFDSLTWAWILNTMVISFKQNIAQWNNSTITADLLCLNEDKGEIEEKKVLIKHANTIDHINEHSEWLEEDSNCPDFEEFITSPSQFLEHIILLPNAIDGLKTYKHLFPLIYEKMNITNKYIEEWKDKQNEPFTPPIKYAVGEYTKRASQFPDRLKGYEAHLYFTGIAGRIHYKLKKDCIEIAYIGEKLFT